MRKGGRCSSSCVIPGASTTTSSPAAQPKSTIAATPNTNESETPPVSIPSTGTGNRSASAEAETRAARPRTVAVSCCVVANDAAAARETPRPAAQTGTMTARSRVGGKTRCVTARLPVEVGQVLDSQLAEHHRDQCEDGGQGDEAWSPVQHVNPPQDALQNAADFRRQRGQRHPPEGGNAFGSPSGGQAGLGERPARPGELLPVP